MIHHLPIAPGAYNNIKVYNPDINFFLNKIKNKEYFAFVRYQDSWWRSTRLVLNNFDKTCINNDMLIQAGEMWAKSWNFSNYKISPEAAYENLELICFPKNNLFISIKSMDQENSKIIEEISPQKEFLYAHCWRQMAENNTLDKLFIQNSHFNFIIIGPKYLYNFNKKLNLNKFWHVEISETNASFNVNETVKNVINIYNKISKKEETMILSLGGFAGNVIIKKLNDQIKKAYLIEMGRSLDAFYCRDNEFKSGPKFRWSNAWFGNDKNNLNTWTEWVKKYSI